jgi:hypothetical protein
MRPDSRRVTARVLSQWRTDYSERVSISRTVNMISYGILNSYMRGEPGAVEDRLRAYGESLVLFSDCGFEFAPSTLVFKVLRAFASAPGTGGGGASIGSWTGSAWDWVGGDVEVGDEVSWLFMASLARSLAWDCRWLRRGSWPLSFTRESTD